MGQELGSPKLVRLVDPAGSMATTVDLFRGATIRSLRTRTGIELFAQGAPPEDPLGLGADFLASGLTGYVDCLPTIEPAPVPGSPSALPLVDHGAVWPVPWTTLDQGRGADEAWLAARVEVAGWPLRLTRTVRASAPGLRLEYLLENTGADPVPVLWAGHGLLHSPAGTRIRCAGLRDLRVAATSGSWSVDAATELLGRSSADREEPADLRLDAVPVGAWVKAYAAWPADDVWLLRPDLTVRVRWDGLTGQRWLGLWLNNSGMPGDRPLRHVAIEPTTGDRDSLADCLASRTAWQVPGTSRHRWTVEYLIY